MTDANPATQGFQPWHTALRKQVEFVPLNDHHVTIYNCGPTVYSTAHIGNFRSFLFADLLRRYLEWRGYKVTQIMNITDVGHLTEDDRADADGEDKLQKAARELGWDPYKVAQHYEEEFHRDRKALGVADAEAYPRATEHIPDMLVMIQQLLDRGHAYIPEGSGEVYYDISTWPEYGKLSGKQLDELQAGARVEVNELKRNPADFALWKTDAGHLMQWDPKDDRLWEKFPGGKVEVDERIKKGFPGWHIECSAMSSRYLGVTFDIHTGGEDNMFPHHECEIAQSSGASGQPFVRYWMHARHLLVDGKKMSKSAGTLYTLADLEERGYSATDVRYLMLANHYRQPMNFTFEALDAGKSALERLQNLRDALSEKVGDASAFAERWAKRELGVAGLPLTSEVSEGLQQAVRALNAGFTQGMDDDLNSSPALAAVFAFASEVNRMGVESLSEIDAREALFQLLSINKVLNVLREDTRSGTVTKVEALARFDQRADAIDADALLALDQLEPDQLLDLIAARANARKSKDFALSDRIRDEVKAKGVTFEDTPQGTRYKLP